MVKVIDNFLTLGYYKELEHRLLFSTFPWYYLGNISGRRKNSAHEFNNPRNSITDKQGFYHILIDNMNDNERISQEFILPFALQVQEEANAKSILRVRAAMLLSTNSSNVIQDVHVDLKEPNISAIFYIGESDGDTVIYNEKLTPPNNKVEQGTNLTEYKRISPKPNRLVLFDGKHIHTGHAPSKYSRRVIINSNLAI